MLTTIFVVLVILAVIAVASARRATSIPVEVVAAKQTQSLVDTLPKAPKTSVSAPKKVLKKKKAAIRKKTSTRKR